MKMYFVRYLESRRDLTVSASPVFIMKTSFDAGLRIERHGGHRRKAHALEWVEKVNKAAGQTVAEYAGAFEV